MLHRKKLQSRTGYTSSDMVWTLELIDHKQASCMRRGKAKVKVMFWSRHIQGKTISKTVFAYCIT
jgi:hypothetical protein